jgi:hypothetical protein
VSSGPVQSQIRTDYYGWQAYGGQKYDLICRLTINAGSRLTLCSLQISANPPNLCTGIVKSDSAAVFHSGDTGQTWQYLANYGRQSLANDRLGMAVLYKKADLMEKTADAHSDVLVLKPSGGRLDYYFLAAWEKEPGGITSREQFVDYLDQTLQKLETPVVLTLR